jgi:hypothetical protein
MGDTGDKFLIFTKKVSNMTNLVSIDSYGSKESIDTKIIEIGQVEASYGLCHKVKFDPGLSSIPVPIGKKYEFSY